MKNTIATNVSIKSEIVSLELKITQRKPYTHFNVGINPSHTQTHLDCFVNARIKSNESRSTGSTQAAH